MIQPRLMNGSFGDPLVYCSLAYVGKAFAFDMGASFELSNRELSRIETIYFSHAHMDHVFGFDNFLRAILKEHRTIEIFGPAGIQKNIQGKLQGVTWNLTDGYGLIFHVHELQAKKKISYELKSREKFRLKKIGQTALKGLPTPEIHKTEFYSVKTAALDHRITSQAYSVTENISVSINPDALDAMGVETGSWLQTLKTLAIKGGGDNDSLVVPFKDKTKKKLKVGMLKEKLILPRRRNRISYVSDVKISKANESKLLKLVQDSDILLCEATFLEADRDKADETCHMTARATGELARKTNAGRLILFHFSKKYLSDPRPLIEEAESAFGKKVEVHTLYKPLHSTHHESKSAMSEEVA